MRTNNKTRMPGKLIMADRTLFRCISRIDIDNSASFSHSFILDKALELPESPLMHPSVVFCGFPDIAQIFHHDNTSIGNAINDSFAYVMVSPSHKLCPSATQFSEMPFGGLCAFSLKPTNQLIMLNPESFDLPSEEEFVGCHSEIVYSEVNAKNSILEVRAFNIDIFGEREQEETSALCVYSQKAFLNLPSEVFLVTVRNSEGHFDSTFDCGKAQDIIFEGSGTREVVPNRCLFYSGPGFSFLDHSAGLLYASDSKLALQPNASEMFINQRMELDIIPNLTLPSSIYTELQSFAVNPESFNYLRCCRNLYFYGSQSNS